MNFPNKIALPLLILVISLAFYYASPFKYILAVFGITSLYLLFNQDQKSGKSKNEPPKLDYKKKPINLDFLLEDNPKQSIFEEDKCNDFDNQEITIFQQKKKPSHEPKEHVQKTKEEMKGVLKSYFTQPVEEEYSLHHHRQQFDDSKSMYSQVTSQNYGIKLSLGRSQQQSLGDNSLLNKVKQSEKLISKLVPKMKDACIKSEELFYHHFLETFIKEFKHHLVKANQMMRDHFNRKIKEIDIFFQNKPNDFVSNFNENAQNKQYITLDEVLYFNEQIQNTQFLPLVPVQLERFEKDKAQLVIHCNQIKLFYNALNIQHFGRDVHTQQRNLVLDRLCSINEGSRPIFNNVETPQSMPNDFEILSSVFINSIMQSVQLEKLRQQQNSTLKNVKNIKSTSQMELLRNFEVGLQRLESFGLKPKQEGETFISRNLFLQQLLPSNINGEPLYHFYSDAIQNVIKSSDTNLHNYILYTPYDSQSLYYNVAYYLIHLLCLPKGVRQQLQLFDYGQPLLNCFLKMAHEFSYLVTL